MKRFQLAFLFLIFLPTLASAQLFKESAEPDSNQSVVYIGSYDWGACVEKFVVNVGHQISPQVIRAKDFEISRVLYPKNAGIGVTKGSLSVTDAFCSDSMGRQIPSPSNFITIITDVHPKAEHSNPFVSITLGSFRSYYGYKIENDKLDISVKNIKAFVSKNVSKFKIQTFSCIVPASDEEKENPEYKEENLTISYASYIPNTSDSESQKIPLILWFHGLKEGGSNIYDVLMGVKANALADEQIQSYFKDGVAILAPQSKSSWLESNEKGIGGVRYWTPVDKNAPVDKIKKPLEKFLSKILVTEDKPKKEKIPFAAESFYTEPIKALLDEFIAEHPNIDTKRIYVGGCSAGGYMTMNMLIKYPEVFAAAFPICEYYLDSKITDGQIKELAKKPLWFTYALNDGTVNSQKNSIATIERLKAAGAEKLHVSEFRNVVDKSGLYLSDRSASPKDESYGLPYEYDGHESWIYLFNDQCMDGETKLFSWLSEQKNP